MPFPLPGKIRIWFDDDTLCRFPSGRTETRDIAAQPSSIHQERRVTAELVVRSPELFPYGLLGAVFRPNSSNVLHVEVNCDSRTSETLSDNLAFPRRTVLAGLPHEFAPAVFDGVVNSGTSERLGGGLLRFDCAAYDDYGSTLPAFERLSGVVTHLLTVDPIERDTEHISAMLARIVPGR